MLYTTRCNRAVAGPSEQFFSFNQGNLSILQIMVQTSAFNPQSRFKQFSHGRQVCAGGVVIEL